MKGSWWFRVAGGVGVAGAAAVAGYALMVRPWHLRWGASEAEAQRPLPGDELVPEPRLSATHAITILASAAEVWPWLVQIGQGRAGFYSYDWIENLMGLNIQSTDRIVPELQHLAIGDVVPLAPGGFGVPVAAIEPGRALVLHGDTRSGGANVPVMKPSDYMNTSWAFCLEEIDAGTTRLIERFRADYNPSLQNTLFYRALLEPGSFVMERGMLLGIKRRAEAASDRR